MKKFLLWSFGVVFFCFASVSLFVLLSLLLNPDAKTGMLAPRGELAWVEIKGPIFSSQEVLDQFERIKKNSSLKGVILRIDSPGGAVGPSQEIYQAVLELKKTKKVIVSMGSVAASGGYYIAVAADQIVANPGTITGSIGVLMDYANIQDLLKFLKIDAGMLTAGRNKGIGSLVRPMTQEDRDILQKILNNMHQQFKAAVQANRHLSDAEINQISEGQAYTGEQALALKMIDKLGNQETAIALAKSLLHLKEDAKILYPKEQKRHILDLLLKGDLEVSVLKLAYALRQAQVLYWTKGI